jgi:hypothetical protein
MAGNPKIDIADVLAFTNVQAAIAQLVEEAARLSGLNPQVGKRMAIGIRDRLAAGEAIQPAIEVVRTIQEACRPTPAVQASPTAKATTSTKGPVRK